MSETNSTIVNYCEWNANIVAKSTKFGGVFDIAYNLGIITKLNSLCKNVL